MAVTVEDGTGVTGANSYVSRADYISYAATIGVTIADDADADYQLIKAAEFIDRHRENLKGYKVTRDQAMEWPRSDVIIDCWSYDQDEIPSHLTKCQMALALDINAGYDIYNREANPSLLAKKERVEEAVSVEYETGGIVAQKQTRTSTADSLLMALLRPTAGAIMLVRA
jgi:hypothetical protein